MYKQLSKSLGCSALVLGLALPAVGMAADNDDLITTASTAGTTAYLVGKRIDEDHFSQAQDFADDQSVALRREAATGGGEHLDALAALLGEDNPQAFGHWVQANYAQLYASPEEGDMQEPNLANRIVAMR